MNATLFMAVAAGVTSALMFASIISGALISLLLCYLAPLPLLVAALGWGPFSAAAGGRLVAWPSRPARPADHRWRAIG
jgi:hypothetical protein